MSKRVFVTVGTTEFDQLIQGIDQEGFLQALQQCGYQQLVVQYGRGSYHPRLLNPQHVLTSYGIQLTLMAFSDKLVEEMKAADLVIGHAGAGTVLEAVTSQKAFIAVVNTSLQDNHQAELAKALQDYDYCLVSSIDGLADTIRYRVAERYAANTPKPSFPINNLRNFATLMDSLFDTNQS